MPKSKPTSPKMSQKTTTKNVSPPLMYTGKECIDDIDEDRLKWDVFTQRVHYRCSRLIAYIPNSNLQEQKVKTLPVPV